MATFSTLERRLGEWGAILATVKKLRATNREIEVKLRVDRPEELIRRIRSLGAVCDGRVFERNTLYDTAGGDVRRQARVLRVRTETPAASSLVRAGRQAAVVTSKAPMDAGAGRRSRYKEKLERELPIRDVRGFETALGRIGLRATFVYEKYRSIFHLGGSRGLHLCVDETPVGTILELEGAPKAIDRAAKALGFTQKEYIRGTYWDLYAADCRRCGVKPQNMMFRA